MRLKTRLFKVSNYVIDGKCLLLMIDSDCRTFDVNDTGRISESKFRQILATKQVPKDDVDGILEGENSCLTDY